ncbi:dihydrofolate reductase family protein [Kineococcus sp. SYSU DK001]|uniref:dihydrofolate reductase family protein n=1 Tax=Kineococcus sp. SYSU DK001 TaxID=3383122 RepID=UPI003D7EF071
MATFVSSASTSLDGFVALPDDTPGPLFDWYDAGDVAVQNAGDLPDFHLTPASAAHWHAWRASLGCLVVGRRLFDLTDGWRGEHPLGVPFVVLTHSPPAAWAHAGSSGVEFATDLDDALGRAAAVAGDAVVGVAAGQVATQVLAAGALDAVRVDLVPVFLGRGRRYFTADGPPLRLGDPSSVVVATGVTHLSFPVRSLSRPGG